MPRQKTTTKPVTEKKVTAPVVAQTKVAKFVDKNIKLAPRKLRLLVEDVKKLKPVIALERLRFVNTVTARYLAKAVKTVISDAKNNFNLDENSLKFDTMRVDESLKIKRMDKSHGSRFARGLIQKRHSRLTITVVGSTK